MASATDAEFYPYPCRAPTDVIVNAAEQKVEPQRDGIRLYVKRSPDLAALPATLHGVVKLSDTVAYDVSAPVVQVANEVLAGRRFQANAGRGDGVGRDRPGFSGRDDSEPDAVRVSGAVPEGAGAGAEFES